MHVWPHTEVMLLLQKITDKYPKGLFWDTAEPYNYIRSQQDEYGDQVLIVGGFDHKTAHATDENQHYEKLEKYLREKFTVESIQKKWSSQFYQTPDGLPYIGYFPLKKHIYLTAGFFGDGLPWGSISAKIITDLILGRETPYQNIFDPSRFKPVASAKEFLTENVDVALTYAAGWIHSDSKDVGNMKPGEARVVQSGVHKVAVYKDEAGCLHKCSAICTHLKAIVKWNAAEKTWDCPAHGGRYQYDGKLLEGPPMHDLEDLGNLQL